MLKYKAITREMITEALVGKKVFDNSKTRALGEDPAFGRVVSGNQTSGRVWVSFGPFEDPKQYHASSLMLVTESMHLVKNMKWAGKTVGALEKFIEQMRVEGADEDTVLNPGKLEHVSIAVELPLATKHETEVAELTVDGKVIGRTYHNHTFESECAPPCPMYKSYPTAAELVDGYHPDMEDDL